MRKEVPSRFELLYTVLQTATEPLGQGTKEIKEAVRTGLEPVTPCVTGMYSNQLN